MNLAIQKPTTLIKIKKISDKDINRTDEDCKLNKIDFYDLDFDNNKRVKSRTLENILSFNPFTQTNVEKSIHFFEDIAHNDFLNKDSFLKMPSDTSFFKEIGVEDINYERKMESDLSVPKVSIDLDFVIDNLKYDIRVKEFEITPENILVYFFCADDSVCFYKQYFKYIDLYFCQDCDWLSSSETINRSLLINNDSFNEIIGASNIKPFTTDIKIETENYSRERFQKMIDHYNQLKSCFTKNDLKIMSINLDKRNTDFVFTNTKELAVGSKSNKIMQEAIKIMSGTELDRVYESLEYDIVPISATKHGAYTIQTLLSYSTNISHRKYIVKYFSKEGEYLLAHEIGNYTFQKLLMFDKNLVSGFLISNFSDIVSTELGIKVFKRCIEHLEEDIPEIRLKINVLKEENLTLYAQLQQVIKNW